MKGPHLKCIALLVLVMGLLGRSSAYSVGILTTEGSGCPAISDHQRFMAEIEKGNFTYQYPSRCVKLSRGTRVGDPVERKRARFGNGTTEFILVEVQGKGKYWTLASWVKVTPSSKSESLGTHPTTLKTSEVWFAKELRGKFREAIPIHGSNYAFDRIACLPRDITNFDVSATSSGTALSVGGSLQLAALPAPFKVIDGAQGPRYMLHLQAYLFSPDGRLIWQQEGFPQGNAWVKAAGDSVSFRLIDNFRGSLAGSELIIVAAGDPILSEVSETRTILGLKKLKLP